MRKLIVWLFKLVVAAVAMYVVFRNISWNEVSALLQKAQWSWWLPALLFYNLSQFVSAGRLLLLYRLLTPAMTYSFNLALYYRGMFYNFFLPGGIGGDVYKVFVLKKQGTGYRQFAMATLFDRLNGLCVLLAIILMLSWSLQIPSRFHTLRLCASLGWLVAVPVYWLLLRHYFRPFHSVAPLAWLLSVGVQLLQLAAFSCLLFSLGVEKANLLPYAFLFYISSVVSALPISIGGLGTRELALSAGAAWFGLSSATLVSASLLFFVMSAFSSLAGWFVKWDNNNRR